MEALLSPDLLYKMEERGLSLERLQDMSPSEIGAFLRHPAAGGVGWGGGGGGVAGWGMAGLGWGGGTCAVLLQETHCTLFMLRARKAFAALTHLWCIEALNGRVCTRCILPSAECFW
jgi:hypothetical protein